MVLEWARNTRRGGARVSVGRLLSLWLALWMPAFGQAVSGPASGAEPEATKRQQTALRDTFVARVQADGFRCPIAPPSIVVDDVPSFGNYSVGDNRLRTSDWSLLKPQQRAFFLRLAGAGADEAAAHEVFEKSVHRWVFVHELGHWWQACRGVNTESRPPYEVEFGANRLALAYWREVDPAFAKWMLRLFDGVLAQTASPVPADQSVEVYFNANYEKLGPSPVYPWFQARMVKTAGDESPVPTFAEVLKSTK